ncbi:MAG: hypothetical protein ACP5D8_08995 [Fidelibacterota bacterium]
MKKNPFVSVKSPGRLLLIMGGAVILLMILVVFFLIPREPYAERTLAEHRDTFRKTLIDSTILAVIQYPPDAFNQEDWKSACWAMGLAQYRSDVAEKALENAFDHYETLDNELKRSLLEVAYGLYPEQFVPEVRDILRMEKDPKRFVMAALYLHRARFNLQTGMEIRNLLIEKFSHLPNHPILGMFRAELHFRPELPPVDQLLSPDFLKGYPVFYTFFRQNRDYPGITICRLADGSLKKEDDQTLWTVWHLGRSNSGLSGYVTHGNTPEGLYSLQGITQSENVFIGPTPVVDLKMPWEISPKDFFHGNTPDTLWDRADYMAVLPPRWRDYLPVYTSYYAGKAGRSEIIAHGTTINPGFYTGKEWYPFTPSLGCLTALELWDDESGTRIFSHQQKLIDCLKEENIQKGFWMVIDLDKSNKPVTLDDLPRFSYAIRKMREE